MAIWLDSSTSSGTTATWTTTASTTTDTMWIDGKGLGGPPQDGRAGSPWWVKEYSPARGEVVYKLDRAKVNKRLMEYSKTRPEMFGKLRGTKGDRRYFDRYFGPGAWLEYTQNPVKNSKIAVAKQTAILKPKFKLKTTVLDYPSHTPDGFNPFSVGKYETLLESFQREFDVWTKGVSFQFAKPGQFTIRGSTGFTIAGAGP